MLPDGTKFYIADAAGDGATMVEAKGFDDIGDLGLDTVMIDITALSDDDQKFLAQSRKEGGERDLICRHEPSNAGQGHIKAACDAKERRKCEVKLPGQTTPWQFTALFGGYKLGKPEAGKAMQLVAKIAIESEQVAAGAE